MRTGWRKALVDYGTGLGMCFQLVDDALDYRAAEATLGKNTGDDFREGKITLPVILAMLRGTEEDCRFWHRTLEEGSQGAGDFEHAVLLISRNDAFEDTLARARGYAERARDALAALPRNPYRDALAELAAFALDRDH